MPPRAEVAALLIALLALLTGCHPAPESGEHHHHHHEHDAAQDARQANQDRGTGDRTTPAESTSPGRDADTAPSPAGTANAARTVPPRPPGGGASSPPVAAPTSPPSGQASQPAGAPPAGGAAGHVLLVVLENHAYSQIIGSPDAPYLNQLAGRYGLAVNYQAVAHPSLPNYLALTGGSTFGITTDCTTCNVDATNLADQLEGRGLTWKAYMDGMPSACFPDSSAGNYAKKHNPFLYYNDIANNPARCQRSVVPITGFPADLASGALPNFSLVVPDQCHDMHSCPVSDGDTWLAGFLPGVLQSPAFQSGGTVLITFDEGTSADNQVATLVLSPRIAAGTRLPGAYTHYSLLRTVEDLFGLDHIGRAGDAQTASMAGAIGH